MSKKITDLTQLSSPHLTDMMLIDDLTGGATKKVSVSDLLNTPSAVKLSAISTTDSSWAWTTYTPAWTATTTNPTIGNGSITGSYTRIGKTVHVQIELVLGSTTTVGSGVYKWTLPIASVSKRFSGSGWALRTGTAFEPWPVSNVDILGALSTTNVQLINTGGGIAHNTRPWGTADIFLLEITYEVA